MYNISLVVFVMAKSYAFVIPFVHIAPFAVPLSKRFEGGYVVIGCGAVIGLSLIVASFAVTPLQLAVCAVAAGKFIVFSSVVLSYIQHKIEINFH